MLLACDRRQLDPSTSPLCERQTPQALPRPVRDSPRHPACPTVPHPTTPSVPNTELRGIRGSRILAGTRRLCGDPPTTVPPASLPIGAAATALAPHVASPPGDASARRSARRPSASRCPHRRATPPPSGNSSVASPPRSPTLPPAPPFPLGAPRPTARTRTPHTPAVSRHMRNDRSPEGSASRWGRPPWPCSRPRVVGWAAATAATETLSTAVAAVAAAGATAVVAGAAAGA